MTFDWHNPYPSHRTPLMARNAVATSHPLATQAGLRMLMRGGSAVDAAIATAAALTVVEPCSNGLGSDAFAIVADGGQLHGLNAAGLSPAAWNAQHFDAKYGPGAAMPKRGWDSVTVPGAVSAWVALHERFGRLPFADLLQPAIELAERGHAVAVTVAWKWARAVPELQGQPGFAETFMPRGRAPEPGERFVFADAGRTLRRIAQTRGEDFYRGETAARIAAHAREHGALLTEADLAAHRCTWTDLIAQDFAGHTVHQIPPSGQGIAALMALGMLQHLPLAEQPVDSVLAQHWQIEAMKLAFADTYRWVADPRAMREVTAADLLHPDYLRERARLIRADRASDFAHGTPPRGGTVYLSVADERGQMVSFIQSNFWGFGSGVVVPGTGVSLQNRGFGFTREHGHPNEVAGAKQPFHTIIPGFLTQGGRPRMAFGVMGGNMQPQGHVQTLVRLLQHRQHPQAACDAPRWKVDTGLKVDFEPTMAAELQQGLMALGHRFEPPADGYMDFGSGQFIWRQSDDPEDGYVAATDTRRDGLVAGF
jgi:gamma-glutamyltranspeptidase/glutathione hydrolase